MARMKHLEHIAARSNHFTRIPKELLSLKSVDFTNNQVEEIEIEAVKNYSLNRLMVGGNKLKAVPNNLRWLRRLREVDLSHNQITELAENLMEMKRIEYLEFSICKSGITQMGTRSKEWPACPSWRPNVVRKVAATLAPSTSLSDLYQKAGYNTIDGAVLCPRRVGQKWPRQGSGHSQPSLLRETSGGPGMPPLLLLLRGTTYPCLVALPELPHQLYRSAALPPPPLRLPTGG